MSGGTRPERGSGRRVFARPAKPWSQMTPEEKRRFAEEFAEAVRSTGEAGEAGVAATRDQSEARRPGPHLDRGGVRTHLVALTAAQTDRACGVLLGAACGDALGAGYEFGTAALPPRDEPVAMIGGGLGGFAPGEWTDDTSQTYVVAVAAATGADLRTGGALDQVAHGLADWFADHPPDVGAQTAQVLSAAGPKGTAQEMTRIAAALHQQTGHTAGNGSLMRTSAVALAHLDDPAALVQAAHKVSALTHADPLAGQACALWCLAIRHAVLTGTMPDLRACTEHLPEDSRDFWVARIDEAEAEEPSTFTGNGFVVTALQAAWSAIVHTLVPPQSPGENSFDCQHLVHALDRAVRIGHDTDTVASIAGALLGARWGATAIPARWRLVLHGWPGRTGRDLVDLATLTVRGGHPDGAGWPGCERIDYSAWPGHDSLAVHPHDPKVYLSGASAFLDVPPQVTAVVSLCRLGRLQVPARLRGKHAEFRLLDTTAADNPNLEYVIDDAARTILRWREEGETVLLHCVAGHSRTPVVAARYATLLGHPQDRALEEVCAILPDAIPNPALVTAFHRLTEPAMSPMPTFRGKFEEPRYASLNTELLIIERILNPSGAWYASGALVKEPGKDAAWVDGHVDPNYAHHPTHETWSYLQDKGGGNGINYDAAFLWIASPGDAGDAFAYVDDGLRRNGHPLGKITNIRHARTPVTPPPPDPSSSTVDPETEEPGPFEMEKYGAMPFAGADVLIWRLVTELVRRHPGDLWPVRTFPIDGVPYDCLTVRKLATPWTGPEIAFNRHGTHMRVERFDVDPPLDGTVLPWPNAFNETQQLGPREWLRWLEGKAGLAPPQGPLPPSTPSSLAIRWISHFLAMQLGSRRRWTAWTQWHPTAEDYASSFNAIPAAGVWARERGGPCPQAWLWFIGTARRGYETPHDLSLKPTFVLSAGGDVWTRSGGHHQLQHLHRPGRSITELVQRTAGDVLP